MAVGGSGTGTKKEFHHDASMCSPFGDAVQINAMMCEGFSCNLSCGLGTTGPSVCTQRPRELIFTIYIQHRHIGASAHFLACYMGQVMITLIIDLFLRRAQLMKSGIGLIACGSW